MKALWPVFSILKPCPISTGVVQPSSRIIVDVLLRISSVRQR
jgi:hypothetical protein